MYHGAPVITCCILSLVGKGVIRRDAINRFELFHFFSRGKFAMKVDDKDAADIRDVWESVFCFKNLSRHFP